MAGSRIAIFGAGYVGLVTGACFAELGHHVVVRDVVRRKIDALRAGEVPIYEPGLDELLERNRERIAFTLDVREALDGAEFVYVAVDTPPTYSGDADLSRVWTVIDELPQLGGRPIVVMKSTVPVGTGEKVRAALETRGLGHVGYVSNPEFTAEGTAVRDFLHPDRIVIGAFDAADGDRVEALHEGIDAPVVRADVPSAEMVKLASNAFLMTRISFINEIANVCEATGADVVQVAEGIGLDHRLGPHFLRAGIGYGGSCLAGRETVLARLPGRTWLTTLERLHAELERAPGLPLQVLAWRRGDEPEFLPVTAVTRRELDGEILDLRTKMGRRIRCTGDHPFVTAAGLKLAGDLTQEDWLPVAQGGPCEGESQELLHVLDGVRAAEAAFEDVIVRADEVELAGVGVAEMRRRLPAATPQRRGDIRRNGAMRLREARALGLSLARSSLGTARNGTYVPATIVADEAFWRVVGLYVAEGHCAADGARRRLQWSFHPTDESDLVDEVARYWRGLGVKATVRRGATSTSVQVSSRLLAGWWLGVLGLGANCYEQRIPDLAWSAPDAHKRALLAGLWRGDGSWSRISRGHSVVLEYGTVSRALADGLLRLLGHFGVLARLKVGRTSKSTCDTYWLVVSGADQVEKLLDLVSPGDRATLRDSLAQTKRIAPTGYRRDEGAAWVRVTLVERRPYRGFVYSLEVPGAETFVTTGGLVVHNCFPKDSLALKQLASNSGYHFQLLNAVIEVNELQKRRVIGKLKKHLGSLGGAKVALLGLAFKPNTDDMREAPSIVLASRLLAEGAEVRTWDPVADARELLQGVTFCDTPLEAVTGADAAVIVTEWPQLKTLASREIREAMRQPLIVDGRNLLEPDEVRAAGFAYEAIGRPTAPFGELAETPEPPAAADEEPEAELQQ
jgi:UDPglucose 6-dehydrogenase